MLNELGHDQLTIVLHSGFFFCCQAPETQTERNSGDSEVQLIWLLKTDILVLDAFDVNLALFFIFISRYLSGVPIQDQITSMIRCRTKKRLVALKLNFI